MRKMVHEMGCEIKGHLTQSEDSIDSGIAAQAMLLAALTSGRQRLGLHASVQRELIVEAGATVAMSIENRERMLAMHEKLAQLASRWKLDPNSFGEGGDKEGELALPAGPDLTLVENEREAA